MKRLAVVVAVLITVVAAGVGLALPSGASALTPNGDQGWFWQMPQPFGGGLTDVTFGSDHDVWAVGGGRIAHSADAGVTWAVQASYPGAELVAVASSDALHGFACGTAAGGSPLILKTDDGGASWVRRTWAGAGGMASLSMPDAAHVWLSGDAGRLLTTADGGMSLTRHAVGAYTGPLATTTVDGVTGWAGGSRGRLWRTTDGGVTWRAQASGLAAGAVVYHLSCTDADHAWALAYRDKANSTTSTVIATSDGGATWRRLPVAARELVTDLAVGGSDDLWLTSLQFDDPLLLLFAQVIGLPVHLRHSTDGGATWANTTVDSTSLPVALACNGAQLCAVGAGILTSSDAGLTWQPRSSDGGYLFADAQAVSAADIWAVDSAGALLHSSDGVRWVDQDAPARWENSLTGLSFPDAQHGWVVGSGGADSDAPLILHTADAGDTWNAQTSPLHGQLAGVDFVDGAHGWIIANAGSSDDMLAHTTDAGAHWSVQRPHARLLGLGAMDFIDANTGWAAGEYMPGTFAGGTFPSAVFSTTDGGKTWTTHALPKNDVVQRLQFTDALHGWAIVLRISERSSAVYAMHTIDGGKTWTKLTRFGGARPTALHFLDAQTGWVAISGKGVYKTTDGGASWSLVSPEGSGTTVLTAADPAHLWALGLGEVLGTVDTSGDTAAPQTWTDGDLRWASVAQTLTLTAGDIGGSGLARTEYSLDEGKTWQSGMSIAFAAPADHSNDGAHAVLFRSIDGAGNREATKLAAVLLDTLGPACTAPKKAVVNAGAKGILRFRADDATSGIARALITLTDTSGHVRRTFVQYAGTWGTDPAPTYYWLRFTCDLKPGYYRITVTASDFAGNTQTKTGRNWLHVVRRGAPRQKRPWWPAGLPSDTSAASSGSGVMGVAALGGSQVAPFGAALGAALDLGSPLGSSASLPALLGGLKL